MPVARQDEATLVDAADDSLIGCIEITGAWEVTVLVECSTELARQATARMFDKAAHEVEANEIRDAVGELTNMIGGGFKGLLPRPCFLSRPLLLDGNDYCVNLPSLRAQGRGVVARRPRRKSARQRRAFLRGV